MTAGMAAGCGAPVTICELAATGMPVVATRHCDIPHVVEDGTGALLADERDVTGLVTHLRRLVAEPHLWGRLTRAARSRIEERFDAMLAQGLVDEVKALRAFNKLLWLQNDLITRHYAS